LSGPATLRIRPIAASDAAGLGAFFEALAADAEAATFFHPHPLTAEQAQTLCRAASETRDGYYIAEYAGRIVGYSMLRGWDEGYEVPSWGGAVHPALRDAGIGKQLLVHAVAESQSRGAKRMRLTVYKSNTRGVHVYGKIGFEFSEKDERSLVGFLPLDPAPALPQTSLRADRLAEWAGRAAA
jgi:ribosomal protein S18 acetylase RimI-like enzyme